MRDYEIRFNKTNEQVVQFLREIGLTDAEIADGKIDYNDRFGHFGILQEITRMDNKNEEAVPMTKPQTRLAKFVGSVACDENICYDVLTPQEVAIFNDHPDKQLIMDMFKSHNGMFEHHTIAANLLDHDIKSYDIYGAENHLDAYKDFPISALRGVHFTDRKIPSHIAEFGRSVLRVTFLDSGGSCIVTSADGEITSAYHVFYDEKGIFRKPLIQHPNGEMVEAQESSVIDKDAVHDSIKLKLPALAGLPYLQWARTPTTNNEGTNKETVWIIGYPRAAIPEERGGRFYTTGTIASYDDKEKTIVIAAGAQGGYSGGAIIDQNGHLLAFTSEAESTSDTYAKLLGGASYQKTTGRIPRQK